MPQFDVFLCHHGPDKPAVRRFADALRTRGLKPWLDIEQLQPGLPWQRELERQIGDIGAAAVFVGASGIGPWQREEIDGYLRKFQELQCPVIPVLLPDAGEAPELPLFLASRTWVDFRGKNADDRESMDRLVWGITSENPAPVPRYADDATRADSEELETLYEQLDAQRQNGEDAAHTQTRILELRRKMRDRQLKAGEFLGDRYKLVERLGQGGFAEVWQAYDRTERSTVALKVLHGQYAHDRSRRERFLRGARKMRSLDHPAVVRVLGDLQDDEDCFFIMEHCAGGDLRQAVKNGEIDRAAALAAVLEVGDALAHAHARGMVHRDVKPANILLTGDGRAKLTDFDLVRAIDTTGGTLRSQGMGTFVYAAPEVMRNAKSANPSADVFSLAMTAVFVLRGSDLPVDALFESEKFLHELELEPGLREVLERALRRKPAERTATIERFCDELRAALEPSVVPEPESPSQAPPPEPEPPKRPDRPSAPQQGAVVSAKSSRGPWIAAALVIAVLGILWVGQAFKPDPSEEPTADLEKSADEQDAEMPPPPPVQTTTSSTPPSNPQPGDRWEDPSSGLTFRYIPKGTFTMGGEAFTWNDTKIDWHTPKHQVTITSGFWMGETEVTQEQWERVMGGNPSYFDACGKMCPVENVSWNDVAEFLEKISESGNAYRLPTEAEWEYATRAGATTKYWSGDSEQDLSRVGWYVGNSGNKTHPVGEKAANKWGLYDVHGNVWEWTLTHWDGSSDYSEFADGRTIDPSASPADLAGPPRDGRVVRGGCFGDSAGDARSAFRYWWLPSDRDQFVGFRVLLPGVVSPSDL